MQFRFRAAPGKYVLHLGIVPFETTGQLTIRGECRWPTADCCDEGGREAQIEGAGDGRSAQRKEMDGYAALRWLTLVPQR